MRLQFKDRLALWIAQLGYSHTEVVALLQSRYFSVFSGLDAGTFSRWITGRTVPTLHKQLLIAQCLKVDIVSFLLTIDVTELPPTVREKRATKQLFDSIDNSLARLSYKEVSKNTRIEIADHTYANHSVLLEEFYQNISALRPFSTALYSMKDAIHYKDIMLKNKHDEIIGHCACVMDIQLINNIPSFISMSKQEENRSFIIGSGYYASAEHYFEMVIITLCLYLLRYSHNKNYAYLFTIDYQPSIDFYINVLKAEKIKYYSPLEDKDKMGVYLLKVDMMKAIASPVFLPKLQKKLLCALKCKGARCKKCNLRDIVKKREINIG